MPPKRGVKAAAAANSPPLDGCVVVLSGTFTGTSHGEIKVTLSRLGAASAATVAPSTTHLIATQRDFDKSTTKVAAARDRGIHVVSLAWLEACDAGNSKVAEQPYLFDGTAAAPITIPSSSAPAPAPGTNGKRQASPDASDEPAPKKAKPNGQAKAETANGEKVVLAEGQRAKSGDLRVPVDENCPLTAYTVYTDQSGLIWDASLNQTNSSNNANKFYRLQLLQSGNTFKTWTRWGRVGDRGQTKILGDGSLPDALKQFNAKFKDKSGLTWASRNETPRPGKYAFVERSYNPDSDEESDADEGAGIDKGDDEERGPQPCTLEPAVQDLMRLIFNQQYFAANMSALNYDDKKMPLGKLSKASISRGFQILKDLAALFNDNSLAHKQYATSIEEAIEDLSNSYYSQIPHAFGRQRPPIIHDFAMLKKEIDLLESLGDMKDAELIMKLDKQSGLHPLDKQYMGLGMKEVSPVHPKGTEFRELARYLNETRGGTHGFSYEIEQIFRIERDGEHDRFTKNFSGPPKDRRLLWHGSRATNFGGILSQGLRIAPPEAPVSGYMFGKGIYLADMSSKSANYCFSHITGGTALLLLCEAELGDPMQTLTNASYTAGEDAKEKGMLSTWGQGMTGPSKWKDAAIVHRDLAGVMMPDVTEIPGPTNVDNAYLLYNEYIVYDVSQIRLRYLFRVKIS